MRNTIFILLLFCSSILNGQTKQDSVSVTPMAQIPTVTVDSASVFAMQSIIEGKSKWTKFNVDALQNYLLPRIQIDELQVDAFVADNGFLTSYTETDPIYLGDPASTITNSNIANWNTALGWGDHSLAGYLTNETDGSVTNEIQILDLMGNDLSISGGNNVDLSSYLDNTDNQTLNLSGTDLTITGGNTVDLSGLGGGSSLWTQSGNDIYYNIGNIGIGQTSPTSDLSILSPAFAGRERLFDAFVSDESVSSFFVYNGTNNAGLFNPSFGGVSGDRGIALTFSGFVPTADDITNTAPLLVFQAIKSNNSTNPENGSFSNVTNRDLFQVRNNSTRIMTIEASGETGFGTQDPEYTVDIAGTLRTTGTTIFESVTQDDTEEQIAAIDELTGELKYVDKASISPWDVEGSNSENLVFNGIIDGNANLRGNVGIGVTSPLAPLHIVDRIDNRLAFFDSTEPNNGAYIEISNNDNTRLLMGPEGSGFSSGTTDEAVIGTWSNSTLNFRTNQVQRMTILNSGEVGIGAETPTTALEVNGTTKTNIVNLVPMLGANAPGSPSSGDMILVSDTATSPFTTAGLYIYLGTSWNLVTMSSVP